MAKTDNVIYSTNFQVCVITSRLHEFVGQPLTSENELDFNARRAYAAVRGKRSYAATGEFGV